MGKQIWFKRHRYGWGFTPVTWQGWVLIAGYAAVVGALATALLDAPERTSAKEAGFFILFGGLATAGFVRLVLTKAPKPRWRWGRKPGDKPEEDF